MLAYAANDPKAGARAASPKALTLVIAGHALVIAAVMAAKMDLVPIAPNEPTAIVNVPPETIQPDPQPEADPRPDPQPRIQDPSIDRTPPIVDMGQQTSIELDRGPTQELGPIIGNDPIVRDAPIHVPVRHGPRLATSEAALKPPYPLDKIRREEEATLKLRLTIDARGRVTAVDPVGAADPSFLESARRHIIRAWRYKPATEDGVAVQTTTVISLSFRLEDV